MPVGGRLSAPEFSFGEAIAIVFKNVVARLVTAPFRAIGKIFQKGDTVEAVGIDPVIFEPGTDRVTRKALVDDAGVETDCLLATPAAAAVGEQPGEGRIEFDLKPS